MKILIRLLIVIVVAISGVIAYFYLQVESLDTNPIVTRDKLLVGQDSAYLIKVNWGITSNHQEITVSDRDKSDIKYNKEYDYQYSHGEPIFIEIKSDSLIIYTSILSIVPERSTLKVKQIKVPGYQLSEYKRDYSQMGLRIFGE